MSKTYHCWRCQCPKPMLTEKEWVVIAKLMEEGFAPVQDTSLTKQKRAEAAKTWGNAACEKYFELTGVRETNPNALWHHRLSIYGPECRKCGHLLRTPKASFCANCGEKAEKAKSPGFWRILGFGR